MNTPHQNPVTAWVGWHAVELAALGVPVGLAITVSAWFWALAVLAGAGWVVHEIRQHRRVQTLRSALTQQHLTTAETESRSAPFGETRENA